MGRALAAVAGAFGGASGEFLLLALELQTGMAVSAYLLLVLVALLVLGLMWCWYMPAGLSRLINIGKCCCLV